MWTQNPRSFLCKANCANRTEPDKMNEIIDKFKFEGLPKELELERERMSWN